MRVLFVTRNYYSARGGAESAARDWFMHISKEVETSLLTNDESTVYRQLRNEATGTLFTATPISCSIYAFTMSRRLKRACAKFNPDLVHIHSYSGFVVIPPNIPAVVTLHDEPFVSIIDSFSRVYEKWLLTKIRGFYRMVRHPMLKRTTAVQALSTTIENQIKEHYPSIKVDVIPNPFSMKVPRTPTKSREDLRKHLNLPRNAKMALSVGNICSRKGIHKLLQASRILSKNTDVHIIVVGKTTNPFWKRYQHRLQLHKEAFSIDNFHLLGYVTDEMLHNLYNHSDIFVSASQSEACNLSMIEAAEYGLPIVSTNVGAAKDIFNGKASILPRHSDSRAVATEIAKQISERKTIRYRRMNRYSWEESIDKLLKLYRDTI